MSFIQGLRNLLGSEQTKRSVEVFGADRSDATPQLILPEVHYFRIRLVEMFITRRTWLGKTWYPAVHGLVKATYGGRDIELPSVADTSRLFEEQDGSGDVVARNFCLTPLLPYRGHTVELLCGLFAMEGANHLGKAMQVLSDFSGLLAAPQLSQALNVAKPLANGVQQLFGAADGRMHLGHYETWIGAEDSDHPPANALRSGYRAVLRAADGSIDTGALRVEQQQLRILDNGSSRPFTDCDHMLLHVERRSQRHDLTRLASFWEPFTASLQALGDDFQEHAVALIRQALAAARTCDDLTKADHRRVTEQLKERFKEAKRDASFSGLVETALDVETEFRLKGSAEAAREAGVPTLQQVWEGL